jgi:hypothetical protein
VFSLLTSRCFKGWLLLKKARFGKEARKRVHFPRTHRWLPGSGDDEPVRRKILSAYLVLRKNSPEVSRRMRFRHDLQEKWPLRSRSTGRFFLRPQALSAKIMLGGRAT